jgi:serine/threonine protein kinase/Tol biopolymer transport system component
MNELASRANTSSDFHPSSLPPVMTPKRWEQIGELYHAALELEAAQRDAYLAEACAGDESLRHEVESLLVAEERAGDFIAAPALREAAGMFASEAAPTCVGRMLNHYKILAQIGAGGMGEVYRALDTKLGREVALKTLPAGLNSDDHLLRRFKNEAEAAATLNHPNIATVYSVEEAGDCHFITMEFVAGQPLSAHFSEGGLPLEILFNWFIPLADAFAHAHAHGIIHRDIKPGNIVVTPAGVPKVLDFGLARIQRQTIGNNDPTIPLTLTRTGEVLGTPAYMSPEQAEGKLVDQRSDLFSFGVVMYEALTGARPFKGDSYAAIISNLLRETPAAVNALRPGAPPLLAQVIERSLRKSPADRYQTMHEVRALLETAQTASLNGTLRTPTLAHTLKQTFTLSRGAALAGLLAAALLIALAGWVWWRSRSTPALPVIRFAIAPPTSQQADLSEAQLSPDGRYLVYVTRQNETRQLYLRPLDQFEARAVPGTEGARYPFFSADSRWIGFFVDENKLKKIPLAGGTAFTICDACPPGDSTDWDATGTIITASAAGLYRVPANGGKPESLTSVAKERGELQHNAPQILPGGQQVLFTVRTQSGSLPALFSLDSQNWQPIAESGEAAQARYLPSGHLLFVRARQLLAAPFDLARGVLVGAAKPVLDGLYSFPRFQVAGTGTLCYLPENTARENALVWVDRSGQATPLLNKRGDYRSPRLSPDGERLAVQVGSDIWVFEVASGRGVRLTFEGENQTPVWSPDGKQIVYATHWQNAWHLYARAADGSAPAEKLTTSETRQLPYSWHPLQPLLAYTAMTAARNAELMLLALPERKSATLLATPFIEDTPRFSPDGRWLVYFSNETGQVEVYVQPYPGPGGKLPISQGGGMFPVWAANGRELFYRRGNKLFAVTLQTQPQFRADTPRVLLEGAYQTAFDVAPDGNRFVMVRNEQGTLPTQINIALHWTEELKRLLAAGP